MRRKSERNKSKGSPEKKVEKPIKKSTRTRRTKRSPSPSTSPEPEAVKEASTSIVNNREPEKATSVQTRLQSKELEASIGRKNEKLSSSESDIKPASAEDEDDNNDCSVWKVARADASPGEIQKLKLCRQPIVETSTDTSLSRKKSNKWQESGEGFAGEADSVDEQLVSCSKANSCTKEPKDSSPSNPSQDSNEEVSDRKEILPETTSANLSDDKPNIDQQGESHEANSSNQSVDSESTKPSNPMPLAPSSNGEFPTQESVTVTTKEETLVEEKSNELIETCVKETSTEKAVKDTSSDEEENDNENENENDNDNDNDNDEVKVSRVDSTSESNDEVDEAASRSSGQVSRATRRKHRNKYRDSSNSETPDSEDEHFTKREVAESYEPEEKPSTVDIPQDQKDSVSPKTINSSVRTRITTDDGNDDSTKENIDSSKEKAEHSESTCSQALICKPAKVNLKRSFSARKLAENNDVKNEETDGNVNETGSQNKENCNNAEQELKYVPRKRRWGTALSTDIAPSFSVSTDSLKVLVPGAKPLPMNEVRLSKDDDEDKDGYRSSEKWPNLNEAANDNTKSEDDNTQRVGGSKKLDAKADNHIVARRKISIVKESNVKSPSPPINKPTNILLIKNLVRPFTLNQIKELLSRTGTIVENGFWMDRIKSKCFVEYTHEDQAFETRQALHGISWPISNPKKLIVEYAMKDDMELARELSKDQPIQRKTEPLVPSESWQQDWGREGKTNSTKVTVVREWDLGKEDGQHHVKEKEREKKEDKKRRQRSRSPVQEVHLPAPARKFKKKEDEPPPAKLLDDLFRKTKATPCIYWLPLTNEQIVVKEEMRRQHMAEHARRLEEMRRAERNRDSRRRRSPRK